MPEVSPSKYLVTATWDDAPHLTREQKEELWESIPPYQREARAKGIPQLGSGAIFPVAEDRITVEDFPPPNYWPRAFALDVGWNATAAVWGAWDRQSDVVYLYSAYKQGQAEPSIHVDAIRARGRWIPGVCDPAAEGRAQRDGLRLIDEYTDLGLSLSAADNAVESGLLAVYRRMVSGRLKVFKSLGPWFEEFRLYRRDENGKVVKEHDHLMDCTRYLVMSGMAIGVVPSELDEAEDEDRPNSGRNATTGY